MKKTILISIVAVVVVIFLGMKAVSNKYYKPDSLQATPIGADTDIDVETSDEITALYENFEKGRMLLGYNNEQMFDLFGNTLVTREVVQATDELAPDMLRWPGGTTAVTFQYRLPGYGTNDEWNRRFSDNHTGRFIDFVSRLEKEPQVALVLPTERHFPNRIGNQDIFDENMEFVEAMFDGGVNVTHVECSNESYLRSEVVGILDWYAPEVFRNVDKYINLCRRYKNAILENHPDIRFGAPWGDVASRTSFYWNVRLIQRGLDVFDFFVPHVYLWVNDRCIEGDGVNERCARETMDQHLARREEEFSWLKTNLPNKGICVTEYKGIHFRQHAAAFPSLVQSDLEREYTFKILDMIKRYDGECALHHRLGGSPDRPAYNVYNIEDDGSATPTANFPDMKALQR